MACTRRPIAQRELDRLVDDIEADLQRMGSGIVTSRDLGLMVLERLRLLDEVAYVRYASVYHDFQSAADFEEQARLVRLGQPEPMMGLAAVTNRRTRRSPTGRRSRSTRTQST
jgi:transcriptional regulator NrdR family protein